MESFFQKFMVLVCATSVVINCAIIIIVILTKKPSSVNILIANWSFITCFASGFVLFNFGHGERFLSNCSAWLCPSLHFLRNWIINMYPLQVLSIVHETCSLLGPRFNNGHIMLRKILTCWLISGVGAIHSLFDTVFSNGDGPEVDKCVKVPLFGNVILGISVESVRAVIFHVGFLFCLMELIYRNWQKLMFLKRVTGNWTLSDRLKRIRFMFIYAILMAMFWVPFGFVMSGYQVAEMSPELQEIKEQVDSNATFCKVWVTIFSVYIAYAPGVVFWIGDKRTDQRHCKPFCTLRSQPSVESATPAIVDFRMNDGGIRMQNLVNLNSDEIEMH